MGESDRMLRIAERPLLHTVGVVHELNLDDPVYNFIHQTLQHVGFYSLCSPSVDELVKDLNHPYFEEDADPWKSIDRLMALIIREEELGHEQLYSNFLTPIICVSNRDVSGVLEERSESQGRSVKTARRVWNLYDFITFVPEQTEDTLYRSLQKAVREKEDLIDDIRYHGKKLWPVLEENPDPPRFRNFLSLPKIREVQALRTSMLETRNWNLQFWFDLTAKAETAHNISLKFLDEYAAGKSIADISGADLAEFDIITKSLGVMNRDEKAKLLRTINIHLRNWHNQERLIFIDEMVGEGGTIKAEVSSENSLEIGAFRIERPLQDLQGVESISARTIALQKYIDALHFRDDNIFKTPDILLPVPVKVDGTDCAFWATAYVHGQTLNEFMDQLNQTQDQPKERAQLFGFLRKKLVSHYAKKVGYWVRNAGITFIPKPEGSLLADYYKTGISDLPERLNVTTTLEHSGAEHELWHQIVNVVDAISYNSRDIVRNNDASLNNCIVKSQTSKKTSLDDLIQDLSEENPKTGYRSVSDFAVSQAMYCVDNQYRWGHITEDIAQIATMYESSFLWEGEKRVDSLFEEFMSAAGFEVTDQLSADFEHMCFYRSARKLQLFCNYWIRHLKKHSGDFDPAIREHMRKNMQHYANLSTVFSLKLGAKLADTCSGSNDEEHILEAKSLVDSVHGAETAQKYLALIHKVRRYDAKHAIRYFAASNYFRKIGAELEKEDCLIKNE